MKIQYKNVCIQRIQPEHIATCAALRAQEEQFFFQQTTSLAQSEAWIKAHISNPDDCLLALTAQPSGLFVGTIGYQKTAQGYEIGRLIVCPKSIYQLVKQGQSMDEIQDIALHAGMALAYYLYQTFDAEVLYAQVLESNRLSNHLFAHEMFHQTRETITVQGKPYSVNQYILNKGVFFNALDEPVDILPT